MEHSFDTKIAKEYGMNIAILLKHIYYWIEKNRANDRHFHDGHYWTYSSVKAMCEIFEYMSKKQISTALEKMESAGLILIGNYNPTPYDRTRWFAITEKGYGVLFNSLSEMEDPKNQNRNIDSDYSNSLNENSISQKGKCNNTIYNNVTITDINTDNILGDSCESADGNVDHPSDVDVFFDSVWKLYPKKYGKSAVKKTQRKKLQKVGYDVLKRCIDRYKNDIATHGTDIQYVMYGSTFFNGRYVDFMDEDTSSEKTEEVTGYVDY